MCVLVVLLRQIPGYPIVVGANRDESLVRPSAGPTLDRDGGVLAPTDLLAGGTWIGVNRDGLFAAITNRSGARPDPGRASRGTLVRAALATPDVAAAAARVDRLQAAAPRNGFNLVLAGGTGDGLLVTGGGLPPPGGAGDGRRVLEPGLHVLTNDHELDVFSPPLPPPLPGLGTHLPVEVGAEVSPDEVAAPPRRDRKRDAMPDRATVAIDHVLAALARVCRDHGAPHRDAVCKHRGAFGTVSSTLLALGDGPAHPARFLFAAGAPCRTAYVDHSALIAGWSGSGRAAGD